METPTALRVGFELEVVLAAGMSEVLGFRVRCRQCEAEGTSAHGGLAGVVSHSRLHDPSNPASTAVVRPDGSCFHLVLGEAPEATCACASLAVAEATGLVATACPTESALELLAELGAAHDRLRDLFAEGSDEAVCCHALSVMVLADRLIELCR